MKLYAVGSNFLLWATAKKVSKAADLEKKCSFMPNRTLRRVPGRLGAAFYGKQMASFILIFTKQFLLKGW